MCECVLRECVCGIVVCFVYCMLCSLCMCTCVCVCVCDVCVTCVCVCVCVCVYLSRI